MWRRSFIATTVAIGGTVDDALAALPASSIGTSALVEDLVARLRAPQRPARAAALASAIHEIALAVDRVHLR